MVATDLAFQPREIRVQAQQRYTVRVQNRAGQLHDWTVDAIPADSIKTKAAAGHNMGDMKSEGAPPPQLHVAAEAGRSTAIAFTPTKPGQYVFYCTVPGHRAAGMDGTLIVE